VDEFWLWASAVASAGLAVPLLLSTRCCVNRMLNWPGARAAQGMGKEEFERRVCEWDSSNHPGYLAIIGMMRLLGIASAAYGLTTVFNLVT